MAQLVAREVWDFDAAGSSPVTPTNAGIYTASDYPNRGFDRKKAAEFPLRLFTILFRETDNRFIRQKGINTNFCRMLRRALRSSYLTRPSFRDVPTEFENRFLCLLRLSLCVVNELTSERFYAILKAEKTF